MRILQNNVRFIVTPGFYIYFALFIFLFPVQWVVSWAMATVVHELFHYCAISAFKIPVSAIALGADGIRLITSPMRSREEVICALAGPLGGLCLILLAKWLPYVAICALVQSIYNLLPIFPLDGGRAIRGIIHRILPEQYSFKACQCIEITAVMIVVALCLFASFVFNLGLLPLIAACILIIKRFPCKQGA